MIALTLCFAALATLSPGGNERAQRRLGAPFPRIANCYGADLKPDSTEKDIAEIARYDLLIGGVQCDWSDAEQRRKIKEKLALVRKRNPHILILDFSASAPYAEPTESAFPKDGWLLQPNGKRIAGWPGTEMINLRQPAVWDWLAQKAQASVAERGCDGAFIDCMGSGFDSWACNIATKEAYQVDADGDGKADETKWLDSEWIRAKTELVQRVRRKLGAKPPFMGNQSGDWAAPYSNGILLEDYLDYVLDGGGAWVPGGATWEWAFGEYQRWLKQARQPNLTTIVSSSGVEPPFEAWKRPQAEQDALLEKGRNRLQRMRFGLTTTLMGDGYFAYDLHTRWRGQRWWFPEYDAPLGYPKGAAQKQPNGTWRRAFDGGTVFVNPLKTEVTVRFDRRHRDISGKTEGREFTMPAQDGRIFLPVP